MFNSQTVIAVTGVMSTIAAVISLRNHQKIREVHVLVNNRLDSALETIGELRESLRSSVIAEAKARTEPAVENGGNNAV